jgi:hypothetical protein
MSLISDILSRLIQFLIEFLIPKTSIDIKKHHQYHNTGGDIDIYSIDKLIRRL